MAYIGVSPSNGVRQKHTYTATASQTTFSGAGSEGVSLSYRDSNYVDVYVNGVKLGDADYTATSGTSIVLGVGAAVNDIVEIITYDVFSVADTVSKADGGTFDGNVTFAGSFTSLGIDDNATSTAITIDSSENVGIGTTSPSFGFEYANSNPILQIKDSNSTGNAANPYVRMVDSAGTFMGAVGLASASTGDFYVWNASANPISFLTNGLERMRIDSSGRTGIGITNNFRGFLNVFNGDDFNTATNGNCDNIYLVSDATSGDNVYGASIAFSRVQYPDRRGAAIASVQTGSDEDNVGLAFFTHPSTTSGDPIVEAMRIDSSGNVGIGTTTPDLGFGGTYLEVASLTATPAITIRSDRAGGGTLQFGDQDDNNPGYISYQHNNDRMVFRAGDNQQVYIDGAGCMMLGTTSTGSAGNGDLIVNGGVYLGGTGSANKLDDYETGSFTLSVNTSGYTLIDTAGFYTKIGRQVTVVGHVKFDPVPSNASNVDFVGLPFTSASLDGSVFYTGVSREDVVAGDIFVVQVNRGTANMSINSMDGVGTGSNQIFVANRSYSFSVTYFV